MALCTTTLTALIAPEMQVQGRGELGPSASARGQAVRAIPPSPSLASFGTCAASEHMKPSPGTSQAPVQCLSLMLDCQKTTPTVLSSLTD